MKKLLAAAFLTLGFSVPSFATHYGTMKIIGIGGGEGNHPYGGHMKAYRVFASSYSGGHNNGACAKTDWWFPSGTTHTFWVTSDRTTVTHALSMAFAMDQDVWISGSLLTWDNFRCEIFSADLK